MLGFYHNPECGNPHEPSSILGTVGRGPGPLIPEKKTAGNPRQIVILHGVFKGIHTRSLRTSSVIESLAWLKVTSHQTMFFSPKVINPSQLTVYLHQAAMTSSVDAALLHKVRSAEAFQTHGRLKSGAVHRGLKARWWIMEMWKCENVKRLGFRDIFPGQSDTFEVVEVHPKMFWRSNCWISVIRMFFLQAGWCKEGQSPFFPGPTVKGM